MSADEFHPIKIEDWDFREVPEEEKAACCIWEYARESATIAMPSRSYCDIFAGNGGLCHALVEGKNRFNKAYNATVCRNADELLECLSSLG